MKNYEIAAVQLENGTASVSDNIELMSEMVMDIKACHPHVDLIVFPELSACGYDNFRSFFTSYEAFKQCRGMSRLSSLAKKNNVNLIFGFIEKRNKEYFNSLCFLDRKGMNVATYRKIHLVQGNERKYFSKGNEPVIVVDEDYSIGLMTCFDACFPMLSIKYALNDADIIVVSSAWENPYLKQWKITIMARALDSGINVVGCNTTGKGNENTFFGHSLMVNGMGEILESLNQEKNSYIYHYFSKESTVKIRSEFSTQLQDMKTESIKNIKTVIL